MNKRTPHQAGFFSALAHTMKLEEQANSGKRIKKAIEERTTMFENEMPKILWD